MATRPEIEMVLGLLCAAYPNFTLQDPTVELWVQEFAEVPAGHLEEAARSHLRTSRFFPSIGEIMPEAQAIWARAIEQARSRVVLLEAGRVDDRDPRAIEARQRLREITSGIGRPMP